MEHYSTPFFRLAKTRHISAIHPPEPVAVHLILCTFAVDADSVTDVQSAPSSLPCKNTDYQRDPSTGADGGSLDLPCLRAA